MGSVFWRDITIHKVCFPEASHSSGGLLNSGITNPCGTRNITMTSQSTRNVLQWHHGGILLWVFYRDIAMKKRTFDSEEKFTKNVLQWHQIHRKRFNRMWQSTRNVLQLTSQSTRNVLKWLHNTQEGDITIHKEYFYRNITIHRK